MAGAGEGTDPLLGFDLMDLLRWQIDVFQKKLPKPLNFFRVKSMVIYPQKYPEIHRRKGERIERFAKHA